MKTINGKTKIWLLSLFVFVFVLVLLSTCQQGRTPGKEYQFFEVSVDDIGKRFFARDVEAILFTDWPRVEDAETIMIVGNPNRVRELTGKEIKADKVLDSKYWMKNIIHHFIQSKRGKRGYLDDARAIFITKYGGYMVKMAADDKVVYGPDYESEQLRKTLVEIGFLE